MKARAPGKLVLSGAYAVLFGAPAIVTAVDRYVVADTSRRAAFLTPEVHAALGQAAAPDFDASALRDDEHKLGLGSSAAIVVASLAATFLERDPSLSDAQLAHSVFEPARLAHRKAQGGGSGVDVAASTFGGTLIAQKSASGLQTKPVHLPADLHIEAWFSGKSARTSALVGRVLSLSETDAERFGPLLAAQRMAAEAAVSALAQQDVAAFVRALHAQGSALAALGEAAGAPIMPPSVLALRRLSQAQDATTLSSGAGGGDSVLYLGKSPPSAALVELRDDFGYRPLALQLGARGVHSILGTAAEPSDQRKP